MPEYKQIEHNLTRIIYKRFGLNIEDEPACLKEARQLMNNTQDWDIPISKIPFHISCLSLVDAKNLFLKRAKEIGIE